MLTTRASAADLPALKSPSSRSEDAGKNLLLSPPHRRRCPHRPDRMVAPEHVQCSVDYQPQQLFSGGNALSLRVLAGDFGANVNIADHGATFADSRESEGDNIGRPLVTEVASIEPRYSGASHEGDRQHRISYALGVQRRGCRLTDALARDA